MNEPDTIEQYCSAYLDKYGSYNDGFPWNVILTV
jgi:hypothetical protein